jgi:hypothetical protein
LDFDYSDGKEIVLFSTAPKNGCCAHLASYPTGTGGSSPELMQRETEHTPSSVAVQNAWSYNSTTHMSSSPEQAKLYLAL